MQLAPTNISLIFVETGSTLPWAFIRDFRLNFREKHSNLTLHLSVDEPTHKRHKYFSQYIGRSLLAYNERELSALFPMSRATPNSRSNLPGLFKQNPSIELSQFLNSWGNNSELFHLNKSKDPSTELSEDFSSWDASDSGNGTSVHRYGRQGIGDRSIALPDVEPDDIFHIHAEQLREREEKVEQLKNSVFLRAQQEINIKRHTDMKDPDCDLRRMNDRVPFKLVYEKLMSEKPEGKHWICPLCGKQAMSYYPKPKGKHVNNHGFCHHNQGGCGNPTNSVNLIRLKLKYKFPQALKWLLANYNPEDYGVLPDYYLFDDDRKKYRHRA